jgi:hypothetical protein
LVSLLNIVKVLNFAREVVLEVLIPISYLVILGMIILVGSLSLSQSLFVFMYLQIERQGPAHALLVKGSVFHNKSL